MVLLFPFVGLQGRGGVCFFCFWVQVGNSVRETFRLQEGFVKDDSDDSSVWWFFDWLWRIKFWILIDFIWRWLVWHAFRFFLPTKPPPLGCGSEWPDEVKAMKMDFVPYIERLFPAMLLGINGEKEPSSEAAGGKDRPILLKICKGSCVFFFKGSFLEHPFSLTSLSS